MNTGFQRVGRESEALLLGLITELYKHEGISCDLEKTAGALRELVDSPESGGAWLIAVDGETVGYFVLTIAFSLEFGGKFGLLDELFIRDEYTGRGIGTATMKFVEQQCREISAATLRLEVGIQNPDARRFYERHGMRREARHLMTKRLT